MAQPRDNDAPRSLCGFNTKDEGLGLEWPFTNVEYAAFRQPQRIKRQSFDPNIHQSLKIIEMTHKHIQQ